MGSAKRQRCCGTWTWTVYDFHHYHSTAHEALVVATGEAVLMLGGTLTATFLALSDARPDLATLSAVAGSSENGP